MDIGRRIRKLRSGRYTQQSLAARVGVSAKTVGRWETGERVPDANALKRLSIALGVSESAFFEDPVIETSCSGRVASPRPTQTPLLPDEIKRFRMVPVLTPSVVERANPDGPGEITLRDAERIGLALAQEFAHVPVDELGVYVMEDDAMARCDLPEGAMAVVWVGQPVPDGDVGLLWVRGRLLVRGVVPRKSGAVDLMSGDGSAFTVPAEETTDPDWFRVLGLVVGRSGFSKIRRSW